MQAIVNPLLQWYATAKRDLPWRHSPTPYGVWVSEIMLQQTRVSAVVAYYNRFMQTLPTVADLAAASPDLLHKLWEGLGYYSRVANLQRAAKQIMADHGGELPRTVEGLLSLAGIGDYTAGAIASIAYGLPTPAVDGNVLRVVARLTGDRTDVLTPVARTHAVELLSPIIPRDEASAFTQAMFELGALICLPRHPDCAACPLREQCYANLSNAVDELPVRVVKTKRREVDVTVLVLSTPSGYVLTAPRAKGLLAGLYGLPYVEAALPPEDVPAACAEWGVFATHVTPLSSAKHVFTHVTWRLSGYLVSCAVDALTEGTLIATADEVRDRYAIPTAFAAYRPYIQ